MEKRIEEGRERIGRDGESGEGKGGSRERGEGTGEWDLEEIGRWGQVLYNFDLPKLS